MIEQALKRFQIVTQSHEIGPLLLSRGELLRRRRRHSILMTQGSITESGREEGKEEKELGKEGV